MGTRPSSLHLQPELDLRTPLGSLFSGGHPARRKKLLTRVARLRKYHSIRSWRGQAQIQDSSWARGPYNGVPPLRRYCVVGG